MVNIEISLIIFLAAKDGEALYSQQKQDQELTVAQIILYCQIQTEIEESGENQSDFDVDPLVMSICRVFSCVVGRGCLL